VDIQNVGDSALKAELTALIEHTLSGRSGEWEGDTLRFTGKR